MPRGIPNKLAEAKEAPDMADVVEGADAVVEVVAEGTLAIQEGNQASYAALEADIQELLVEAAPLRKADIDDVESQDALGDLVNQINALRAQQAKLV